MKLNKTSKLANLRLILDENNDPWATVLRGENGCKQLHLLLLKDSKESDFEELVPEIKTT